jgi:hypothetical protein
MRIVASYVVLVVGLFLVIGACVPVCAVQPPKAEKQTPLPHPKGYVCFRLTSPIMIDGALTDPAWEQAPWTENFQDIEGDRKTKPTFRTRVKMLWDDEALYIAAELEEPHVRATLREHDSVIFHDNDFEVFLDPDGDSHLYGELELNAFNTTWDLLLTKPYKDSGRALNAWEIIGLKTAVKVHGTVNNSRDTDKGWTVEIRWPWKGIRELSAVNVPPKDGDQWRINFSRVQWDIDIVDGEYKKVPGRPEHNWVWSPQWVIDMHRPERWGYLQFSTEKPGKADFRPDPDWELSGLLHRAYYAQRQYRTEHKEYAPTAAALGLREKDAERVIFEVTRSGYESSIVIPGVNGGKDRRLCLSHDARFRKE